MILGAAGKEGGIVGKPSTMAGFGCRADGEAARVARSGSMRVVWQRPARRGSTNTDDSAWTAVASSSTDARAAAAACCSCTCRATATACSKSALACLAVDAR
jgi:hypothetical protein